MSCPVKCPKSPLVPLRSELPSRQTVQLNLRMPFATSSCSTNQPTNQPLGTESKNLSCFKIVRSWQPEREVWVQLGGFLNPALSKKKILNLGHI